MRIDLLPFRPQITWLVGWLAWIITWLPGGLQIKDACLECSFEPCDWGLTLGCGIVQDLLL